MKMIAFVVACLLGSVIHAQSPPSGQPIPGQPTPGQPTPSTQPQRTPPRAARPGDDSQKGTAILRGYVIAAETGNPLRRAMVNARSQDGRTGGVTTTDADGRFEIKDLLGGRYSIVASKAGYVAMQYGQRRPEQPGTILEVIEGQIVEKIAFALPRGGVISGQLTDEFGEPIAGAQVNAMRFRYVSGGRRLVPSGSGSTDDRGAFRLFGLMPGEYFVSGALRSDTMMGAPSTVTSNIEGYAPTYFPGTPNASEAQRIIVRVGQETTGITFALSAIRLVRISGRAMSSTGEPQVQAFVSLTPIDRFAMPMAFGNATTRGDGTFQIMGVVPGSYTLTLRPRGTPGVDSEFGTVRLTVGDDDIDNLLMVTSRGAIARGMITTDEGTPPQVRPQQVYVSARPLATGPTPTQPSSSSRKIERGGRLPRATSALPDPIRMAGTT